MHHHTESNEHCRLHRHRGGDHEHGRGGRGRGRRRFRDLESLESLQRDLEQAAADIAERIRRIREREGAGERSGSDES